ncbi:MAG: aminoacyl-tRNA hydrolase [Syntrophales bacterium]
MKLIVGLGNPGNLYRFSRHNAGFLVLDWLSEEWHIPINRKRFNALFGKGKNGNEEIILIQPQTFMNLSGKSVKSFFEYYRIEFPEQVIAVHDDLDLPFGTIRMKSGGGHGGHKGLISMIEYLGSQDFQRVRVGIGRPPYSGMVEQYVLSIFTPEEMTALSGIISTVGQAIDDMMASGIQAAMNKYHGQNHKDDL